MQTNFLDLARQGKNEWWRYALSTVLILFFWLAVNNTVSALPVPPIFTVTTMDAGYNLVSFIIMGVIFYGVLYLFHRQKGLDRQK